MEIGKAKRLKQIDTSNISGIYIHDVSLYKVPPIFDVHMKDFETLTFERLKLLRIIENAGVRLNVFTNEWKELIYEDMLKEGLKDYYKLVKTPGFNMSHADVERRTKDHMSHFILLLAYSQSEGNRQWFLQREIELFRLRFGNLSTEGIRKFIESNRLKLKPISAEEKGTVMDRLRNSTLGLSPVQVEINDFYRVNFWEVPDLVKNMRVFLKGGYAYVPGSQLISIVINVFRTTVNRHLSMCISAFDEYADDRVRPLLENLFKTYTGEDYGTSKNTEEVSVFMLHTLSKQSYPLCMRKIHEVMCRNHHVKYHARQQYQLFLKGIGLSMESCIQFFRDVFTKKLDPAKFDKEYAYNIRHNYGKEGSRTNYTPKSCVSVINSSVGPNEAHGCVFRNENPATLRQKLNEYGITTVGTEEIMNLVKNRHYQIACSKYFEFTHKGTPITIVHPNQYFEESRKIRSADNPQGKNTPASKNGTRLPPKSVHRVQMNPQVNSNRSSQASTSQESRATATQSSSRCQPMMTDTQNDDIDWDDDNFDVDMLDGIDGI